MTDFVVDKGAQRLIDQVLAATRVARRDIGTIAGPTHRQSGPHFPEDPAPPGNPLHQVDAVDFPNQPDKGLDCAQFTEQLRLSRDSRLYLVIWNGQQFSSYAKNGVAPFTWRPYSGEDMHREHCHVEVNDVHHDEVQDWKVFDMATGAYPTVKEIWDEFFKRTSPEWSDKDGDGERDPLTLSQALFGAEDNAWQILKIIKRWDTEGVPVRVETVLSEQDKKEIAQGMVNLLADNIIFIPKAKVTE